MSHALLGHCYLCVPQPRTMLMKQTGKEYVGHAIRYMQPDSNVCHSFAGAGGMRIHHTATRSVEEAHLVILNGVTFNWPASAAPKAAPSPASTTLSLLTLDCTDTGIIPASSSCCPDAGIRAGHPPWRASFKSATNVMPKQASTACNICGRV